jgi:hypothetical protein
MPKCFSCGSHVYALSLFYALCLPAYVLKLTYDPFIYSGAFGVPFRAITIRIPWHNVLMEGDTFLCQKCVPLYVAKLSSHYSQQATYTSLLANTVCNNMLVESIRSPDTCMYYMLYVVELYNVDLD